MCVPTHNGRYLHREPFFLLRRLRVHIDPFCGILSVRMIARLLCDGRDQLGSPNRAAVYIINATTLAIAADREERPRCVTKLENDTAGDAYLVSVSSETRYRG